MFSMFSEAFINLNDMLQIVPALLTSAGDACLDIATVKVDLNAAQGRSFKMTYCSSRIPPVLRNWL